VDALPRSALRTAGADGQGGAVVTEVVYYVASSLDGFIATPDGGVEWLAPFEQSGQDYGYAAFYASVDAVLLGSHTFEQALTFGAWPYPGKPAWVFSSRSLATPPQDVAVTARDPREVVADLEAGGFARAWLVGGGSLAGSFQREGLITEYVVSIMPVILGAGIPLLGGSVVRERLRVLESTPYPDGVLQVRYTSAPADV
jgi:dihydrofolate reductase